MKYMTINTSQMMTTLYLTVLLVQGIINTLVLASEEVEKSHCMQQERNLDSTARKLIPAPIKVFDMPEVEGTDLHDLSVALCPNEHFIKISLKVNSSQDHSLDMCYRVKSIRNGELLAFQCFRITVMRSRYSSSVDCWFPMKYFHKRPVINVWVNYSLDDKQLFYGDLNTSLLDPENTCGDMCEVTTMLINKQLICQQHDFVLYDSGVEILRMTFNATKQCECAIEALNISNTEYNRTDYVLNCRHHGSGQIKILYKVRDRLCLKYQDVTVICPEADVSTHSTTISVPPIVESFRAFVVFGVVCMVVITTAVVVIIFAIQRIPALKRWCFGIDFPPRRHRHDRASVTLTNGERQPLHSNNIIPAVRTSIHSGHSAHAAPVNDVILSHYVRRMDSISSTGSRGSRSNGSTGRVKNVKQLHRSATMALLENTEASYRKKILILPTPFDPYSRDVTNLLKTVFTLDANIPSQSCFDREVHSQYLTGNKQTWIEQLLADIDRILIFLCFTSLKTEGKRDNFIVEEVLSQLLLTNPRPLCKVIFVHVTDSSENLEINHHGDSFHLSHPHDYFNFISEVLCFTGRSEENNPELFRNVKTGLASQQFLKYVGFADMIT